MPALSIPSPADDSAIGRDPYFDNAKLFLIVSVVGGHSVEPYLDRVSWMHGFYCYLNVYCIPMFALISGHFSRRPLDAERIHFNLARILFPFLIFQVLYSIYDPLVFGKPVTASLLMPYWFLWYFLSLFFWRMLLFVWVRFRYPVLLSVVLALAIGRERDAEYFLSVSRTFVFLPFFLLGYRLDRRFFDRLTRWPVRAAALVFLAATIALTPALSDGFDRRWLYGSLSYESLGQGGWTGMAIRAGCLAFSAAVLAALMALIPRRTTWVTASGSRGIYPHFFHGFFIKGALALGLYGAALTSRDAVATFAVAAAGCFVMASEPFKKLTQPLVDPSWLARLLLRRSESKMQ